MVGHPKYTYEDKVEFEIMEDGNIVSLEGTVYIVDAYGTFDQNEEPSYDIMVEHSPHFDGDACLYKHIRESHVVGKVE